MTCLYVMMEMNKLLNLTAMLFRRARPFLVCGTWVATYTANPQVKVSVKGLTQLYTFCFYRSHILLQ